MEKENKAESLGVPRHFPGPINGNPYAVVDRRIFGKSHTLQSTTPDSKMSSSSGGRKSFDVTKGIKDLDNLLSELGYLSETCKRDMMTQKDVNSNFSQTSSARLPTINVVSLEATKSDKISTGYDKEDGHDRQNFPQIVIEARTKPRLPPRTSSVGAVDRHHGGTLQRAFSDAAAKSTRSSNFSPLHPPVVRYQSQGSDDVFTSDEPVSPAISEMLNELANSPLSPENARRFWHTRRPTNLSTKYENVSESSYSEADEDSGEFRQGRVKDHVRQFNRILSSPDPTKVGTGVPMPGLVQGINFEDKISKFNSRSLAPGQCGPTPDKIYLAGSPPKKIWYDTQPPSDQSVEETIFIPSYADRPAAYYLERARAEKELTEQQQQHQGVPFRNGHIPTGNSSCLSPDRPLHVHVADNMTEYSDEKSSLGGDRSDVRSRSDSAYGGSVKGSSVASTPIASNPPTVVSYQKNDNGKSSGRGSHTSSVASLDDQDSSGYARIEDLENMADNLQKRQNTASARNEDIVQEQEVIAVSHTVTENFPERLNRRVPDIKSDKDLSIAVYQTNYLPGLTNGQPKLLSNNQIDMGDRSPDNETLEHNMNLKLASTNGFSSPDTLSPNRHLDLHMHRSGDALKKTSVGSDSSLGPGIHLVDSPPSPAYSARSDSSSVTPSPGRKTFRHKLRRSNSSSSSVSSSELFPDVIKYPHVRFDKDNLKFWYKPKISRDEAIALLKNKSPGTFVVRDSQSYEGAFGLAVKVDAPPIGILQHAGQDLSKVNLENELVRHFLIEPCKQGVRLKGNNNEPAFPSLVALIFQHSVTKMALPIELVLPSEDIENSDSVDGLTEEQLLKRGAACDLVYLASIEVEGLSGDGAIKYAINKVLSTSFNVKSTTVGIKVNQEGITLTDYERRIFFRKHFIMKDVLCCMLDPRGRRYNLKMIMPEVMHEAACFGIVVRKPQNPLEHECLVFAELDAAQPASAAIDFVQRAMKNGKK